ncbi:ATP-dependent RNA helicase HrpA [Demequina zhanjiangensis]|uniref:ATP-dependent RNA helicase HrpA n=1 Tax=Demequina zhanjiangensis TaxID=3051659 RepID=A0ABT8G3F7_9MICO|nr:ATP-dependent RNA helicase HrpA [Demequina sp. SYSU T00b26]MDN4473684.1 ATP-dependent RNA helicase HrpA [Demequina sp. SYSU T00b26]
MTDSTQPEGAPARAQDEGSAESPGRRGSGGRGRRRGHGSGRGNGSGRGRGQGAPRQPRVSIAALAAAAEKRAAVELPPITYPAELPVSARREDIAAAIRDNQVVIVAGETGSGKTTQLPKICLELGRGRAGQIGHTQPRRIAARSVAERIAEEIGTTLGGIVGYQVRFTDESSPETLVRVMTDGVLLAQIQRDPELRAYDTLIIDEAHERSLNIDFLLGYLTNLLPRRPDLKVIITSATIDSQRFARHFAPGGPLPYEPPADLDDATATPASSLPQDTDDAPTAPVVEVTGRTYPVEILYRPLEGETKGDEKDLVTGIVDACDELMTWGDGDILVFLSGEREIRDAADALEGHYGDRVRNPRHPRRIEVLPLYSRLTAAEQHRVFERHTARRIVLSTNVAETSLTVPGIHYVVDPGTARISRYSKATKVQRLPIEPISQASANQRSGRAGRLADGIAIRLYSQEDFESRPRFTEPEILRTSLASVLLQMISVGVVASPEDMASFPFVEPPDTRAIRDGMNLLAELGAITQRDGGTRLTDVGRALARLPMDPRQARMIVEAAKHGVAHEVAVIAAAMSIQDPRERPSENREAADLMHRRFADPSSDLLSYLNLWEHLRERRRELSGSAFRRLVKAEHLHYLRVREWQDVVQQIREAAKPLGIQMQSGKPKRVTVDGDEKATGALRHLWNEEAIHRSVLAGLLSQIGMQETIDVKASDFTHLTGDKRQAAIRKARKRASNEYLGSRGVRFAINPGSPLSKKPPEFVMAAEIVETNRLWARDVASIKPEWAEELAGELAKHTYSDPHWSTKQGAAMAHEKVLLYGVPIISDRTILWGRIRPAEAREMFVRHALVQGEWTTHHRFWKDNQRLLDELADVEARSRTRGLIADDETLFDFYDERIPDSVVSARHFDRWWKDASRATPDLLTLRREDLLPPEADVDPDQFPDSWPQGELALPLQYAFEPGALHDGVTVRIPLTLLPRVVPDGFDWLVPGLLDELATETVRALPKAIRRRLVPAPDTARDVVAWLRRETPAWEDMARAGDMAESFRDAFTRAIKATKDVDIPDDAWLEVDGRLPSHLRVTFEAVEGKRTVSSSTDLIALQRELAPKTEAAVRRAVAQPRPSSRDRKGGQPSKPSPADLTPAVPTTLPEQEGLTAWPTLPGGTLPDHVEGVVGGVAVRGYPAIVAEKGRTASLRILPDAAARDAAHPAGIRRLLVNDIGLQTARVTSRWNSQESLLLASAPYRSTDALVDDLQLAAVTALTTRGADTGIDAAQVTGADTYAKARTLLRERLEDEVHAIVARTLPVLQAARDLDSAVRASTSMALLGVLSELRAQSAELVSDGFLRRTPPERLRHLTRYLKAAKVRLEKAAGASARDTELAWKVREIGDEYQSVRTAVESGRPDPERTARLDEVRWMLEEYRVSLFAQQLGTDGPVSDKRIRKALAEIR